MSTTKKPPISDHVAHIRHDVAVVNSRLQKMDKTVKNLAELQAKMKKDFDDYKKEEQFPFNEAFVLAEDVVNKYVSFWQLNTSLCMLTFDLLPASVQL